MTSRVPESVSAWPAVANMILPRGPNGDDDEDKEANEDEEPPVIRYPYE
jgi:hypothetical protein